MNLREKAIKSFFWFGGTQVIVQVFSWASTFLIVRLLAPSDFGLFSMALSYYGILESVYDLNLGSALLQKEKTDEKEKSSCFWLIFLLSIFFYFLSWFLAIPISHFFGSDRLVFIMRVMGLGVIFQSLMIVPYWNLTKELDFEKRSKATLCSNILSTLTCLVLAFYGFGVWALVMRFLSLNFFLTVFIYFYSRWVPDLSFKWKEILPLVKFGLVVTGERSLEIISRKIDVIIIGKILNEKLLGFYNVAIELSRLPISKVIKIVNQISFPIFANLQNDIPSLRQYFLKISRLIAVFSFPLLVGGAYIAKDLVLIFFGYKWLKLATVFQILCISSIFQTLNGVVSALNKSVNKPQLNFKFTLSISLLVGLFLMVLTPYGIEAAALSWIIVYPAAFLWYVRVSMKNIGLSIWNYLAYMLPSVASSLIMVLSLQIFNYSFELNESWVFVLANVLIGGLLYFISMFFLFNEVSKELFGIIKDLKNK